MNRKSKRSKACDIQKSVKEAVWKRDGGLCVICGSWKASPNAHYISRSHGGLGIEQNIVTLCRVCHDLYDNGGKNYRQSYGKAIKTYLQGQYADWCEDKLKYKKEI